MDPLLPRLLLPAVTPFCVILLYLLLSLILSIPYPGTGYPVCAKNAVWSYNTKRVV
jgi:hypothetical protein